MSGVEISGIVLGALPIVLDGFRKLNRFCLDCEDYHRQLIRAKVSVTVQGLNFRSSIRLLFRGLVSEEFLTRCLDNADERVWKVSSELRSALAGLLTQSPEGESLQAAIEEMRQLFKELLPYLKTATPDHESKQEISRPKSQLRMGRKLGWHIGNRSRVEAILGLIEKVNGDIRVLVRDLRECTRQNAPNPVQLSLLHMVEESRGTYMKLFKAFSKDWAHCGCRNHSMSLALLVKCPHFQSGIDDIAPCSPIETVMVKEKYGWHLDVNEEEPEGVRYAEDTQGSEEKVRNFLCNDLSWENHDQINPNFIKFISAQDSPSFRVTMSDCHGHPRSLWQSLSAIFQGVGVPEDLQRFPQEPRRCLELAYSLSLHLLRLYSTSWLTTERVWSNQEIVFFPNHDKNPFYAWRNATPYLFPSCELQSGRALSQVRVIKHPHVFALGVLLLELALSRGMDTELSGDAFFSAVIKLANTDEVERRMGRKYADTVRTCLYFQFDNPTGYDFDSPTVQKAFMENVVGPLGQYSVSFDGSPLVISAR